MSSLVHRPMPQPPTATLCVDCADFVVADKSKRDPPRWKKHSNLMHLKQCASRDGPGACHLCRLLWANVQTEISQQRLNQLLTNWPVNHGLTLRYAENNHRVELCISKASSVASTGPDPISSVPIFAEEGSKAGLVFKARVAESTHPSNNFGQGFQIIQKWLHHCQTVHLDCGKTQPTRLPERLVDITPGSEPRLVEPKHGDLGRYVALSYSWGEKQQGKSVHQVKLVTATLESFKKRIDCSRMTLAHREAIQVARELGYRYIWIDALCIIQDSHRDWEHAVHNVPHIYSNAEMTIMAGRSHDSRLGFSTLSNWYKPAALPVRLPFGPKAVERELKSGAKTPSPAPKAAAPGPATCGVSLPRSREIGPCFQRAWCFQEYILSRRIVIFGSQQIFMKCRHTSQYEDGQDEVKERPHRTWYRIAMLDRIPKHATTLDVLTEWNQIITDYSTRDIYDPLDCYAALSGVARRIQDALAKMSTITKPRYLAGLWLIDGRLLHGLLWRSSRIQNMRLASRPYVPWKRPRTKDGKPLERAPSWSWLSVEGSFSPHEENPFRGEQACSISVPAWAKQWTVDLVVHQDIQQALPFALAIKGRLLQLRNIGSISQPLPGTTSVYENFVGTQQDFRTTRHGHNCWTHGGHGAEGLRKHGKILQSYRSLEGSPILWKNIALGLYDFDAEDDQDVWGLPVISDKGIPLEGLLLTKKPNGSFRRLGVFWIWWTKPFEEAGEETFSLE